MDILNRKETINFRSFMDESYKEKKLKFNIPMMGILVSPMTIFSPPPVIVKGYLIVFVVGFVLISATFLEKYLATNNLTSYAASIIDFIKGVMPWALIAALILFVLNNPLI